MLVLCLCRGVAWRGRGMGEPKAGLNNAIVVGVVNLVLDPVLMFVCGLGVTGAAMATAAAQWVRSSLARDTPGGAGKNNISPLSSLFRRVFYLSFVFVLLCSI